MCRKREYYLKRLSVLIMILFIGFAQPIKVKAAGNVARIGRKNYKSLQTAMDAVKNGQTIKLLKNVTINSFSFGDIDPFILRNTKNRKYTINLNKHKLIAQSKGSSGLLGVLAVKKGTVTIKNGTLKGIITIGKKATLNLSNIKYSGVGLDLNMIQNSGKLTMNKVSGDMRVTGIKGSTSTLTNCKLTHTSNMINGTGTVNIKSGTYTSKAKTNAPLIILDGGSLNIYGGTFTSPNSAIVNTDVTAVTIKGGSFTATNCEVLYLSGNNDKKGKVKISGGTFTTNQKGNPANIKGAAAILSNVDALISGGTFVSTTYLPQIKDHIQNVGTVEMIGHGLLKITGGSISGNSLCPIYIGAAAKNVAIANTGVKLKTNCPDGTLVAGI